MIADHAHPRLADGVAAGRLAEHVLVLSRMQSTLEIRLPVVTALLARLDGATSVSALVDLCDGSVAEMATAYHWLDRLLGEGWISLDPVTHRASELLHWTHPSSATCLITWDLLDPRIASEITGGAAPDRVIAIDGDTLCVSPPLNPGSTPHRRACWACTVAALRTARPTIAAASTTWDATRIALPVPTDDILTRLLVAEPLQRDDEMWFLQRYQPNGEWLATHPVRRRDVCPDCGGIAAGRRLPPITPDDVLDPLTGFVHDYRELTVTPAAVALGWCLPDVPLRTSPLRIMASGRGATPDVARAAVAYEAVERCSAYQRNSDRFCVAPLDAVADTAIAPNAIMQYSATQLATPQRGVVPEPLPDGQPIAWTTVQSLTTGATRLVPTGLCYLSAAPNDDGRWIWGDSNGCAAGVSLDDATARALLELIERDASAMWWYSRGACTAVAPSLCGEAWHDAVTRWAARGRDAWVLDLTTDLNIPTVAAVSCHTQGRRAGIAVGFGVAMSIPDAVTKALGELAQTIEVMEHMLHGVPVARSMVERWWMHESIDAHPWLRPANRVAPPPPAPIDPGDNLAAWLCAQLAAHQFECLRLDLTRRELGIPVVRMFVPGLRSIRRRLGGSRWSDVPLKLGRLSQVITEADANPIELPY